MSPNALLVGKRASIIQVGKSTFTLFCSYSGRRAAATSRNPVMSSPYQTSGQTHLLLYNADREKRSLFIESPSAYRSWHEELRSLPGA